jgi:hypothetical protein
MQLTTDFVTDFVHGIASDEQTTVPTDFSAEALIASVYAVKFTYGRGWNHLSPSEQDDARIEHLGTTLLIHTYQLLGI